MTTVIPKFMNQNSAARYLGVEPRTMANWRSSKKYNIPYVKVGSLVKYRQSDLDDFLESRTMGKEGDRELEIKKKVQASVRKSRGANQASSQPLKDSLEPNTTEEEEEN